MRTSERQTATQRTKQRPARRRRLVLFISVVAIVGLVARSAFARIPGTERGVPECRVLSDPTAVEYIVGVACPPGEFAGVLGYEPVLVETPYGWRYTRPPSADGGCNGPIGDSGPFWNFTQACRAHDYGYPDEAPATEAIRVDALRDPARARSIAGVSSSDDVFTPPR